VLFVSIHCLCCWSFYLCMYFFCICVCIFFSFLFHWASKNVLSVLFSCLLDRWSYMSVCKLEQQHLLVSANCQWYTQLSVLWVYYGIHQLLWHCKRSLSGTTIYYYSLLLFSCCVMCSHLLSQHNKCLTGCGPIVYSWTLRKQRSSGVQPLIGRTICHLLMFVLERTMCCPRQLFATLEFSSTAMSLCGPMCRIRCPDVSLCYDSSAVSDAQCPILCSIP